MLYIISYFILGLIISIISWFYYTSYHNSRIEEGHIFVYLIVCLFLWPIVMVYDIVYSIISIVSKFKSK